MAYGTRYRCEFSTVNGRALAIEIQQDGWTGGVTMVEGGATPIVTQEDSADEVYAPVRGQTGTLNLIQEGGALDGLVPQNVHEFSVLLQDEATQDYLWRGFIKPEALSQDWAPEPYEVSYSLASPLEALEAFPLDYSKGFGMASLGDTLAEIISNCGLVWNGLFFPDEFWTDEWPWGGKAPAVLSDLLRLIKCSRWNWFSNADNDNENAAEVDQYNATTCREWLDEFCKFFGWTAYERGEDLWFVSRTATDYHVVSQDNFIKAMAGSELLTETRHATATQTVYDLPLDGDQHKESLLQGRKKVTVRANVNTVGEVTPQLAIDGHAYLDRYTMDRAIPMDGYTIKMDEFLHLLAYRPEPRYNTGDVMHAYDPYVPKDLTGMMQEIYPNTLGEAGNLRLCLGALPVRFDFYTQADLDGGGDTPAKYNYNFADAILLRYASYKDQHATLAPFNADGRRYKIVDFKSPAVASYDSGAFCINFETMGAKFITGGNPKIVWYFGGAGWYEVQFHVGEYYWNGAAWQWGECWFSLQVEKSGNTTGRVKNTKTLEMPYNGLDGYVMPITQHLSGSVGFAMSFNHNKDADDFSIITDTHRYTYALLKDFRVEWKATDSEDFSTKDGNGHTYAESTGADFEDEAEIVELKMASDNNDPASYSKLFYKDKPLSELYDSKLGLGALRRPELSLLERLKDAYGHTAEKLELELEQATDGAYRMPRKPDERYTEGLNTYVHLCAEQDWKMAHEKLTIIQI